VKESDIERYLDTRIKELGGTTRKFVSPGRVGVPDRICFLPSGFIFLVEVKMTKGKLSVRQEREIGSMRELGVLVYVVHGHNGVDAMMRELSR
jgi:hypothetical protein